MAHNPFVPIKEPIGPGWVNIPTNVRGDYIGPLKAGRLFRAGKLRPIGRRRYKPRMAALQAGKRHFQMTDTGEGRRRYLTTALRVLGRRGGLSVVKRGDPILVEVDGGLRDPVQQYCERHSNFVARYVVRVNEAVAGKPRDGGSGHLNLNNNFAVTLAPSVALGTGNRRRHRLFAHGNIIERRTLQAKVLRVTPTARFGCQCHTLPRVGKA